MILHYHNEYKNRFHYPSLDELLVPRYGCIVNTFEPEGLNIPESEHRSWPREYPIKIKECTFYQKHSEDRHIFALKCVKNVVPGFIKDGSKFFVYRADGRITIFLFHVNCYQFGDDPIIYFSGNLETIEYKSIVVSGNYQIFLCI